MLYDVGMTHLAPRLSEQLFLTLSREIAIGIRPLHDVLATANVTQDQWQVIEQHPRFRQLLQAHMDEWHAVGNTHERVKLKSSAIVEQVLPELYRSIVNEDEGLNHRNEVLKTVARLAGMGLDKANVGGDVGEKFSLVINIGDGQDHKISATVRDQSEGRPIIDVTPNE